MRMITSARAALVTVTLALAAGTALAHEYYVGGTPDKGGEEISFEFVQDVDGIPDGFYRVVRIGVGDTVPVVVEDAGTCKADIDTLIESGGGMVKLKNPKSKRAVVSHTFQVTGTAPGAALLNVKVRGEDAGNPEGDCTEDSQNPIAVLVTPSVKQAVSQYAKDAKGLVRDGRKELRGVNVDFKKDCNEIRADMKRGQISPTEAAAQLRLRLLEGLADCVGTTQIYLDELGDKALNALDSTGNRFNVPADLGSGGCGAYDSAIVTMNESLTQTNESLIKTFKKTLRQIGQAAKDRPYGGLYFHLVDATAQGDYLRYNVTEVRDLPSVKVWSSCSASFPTPGGGLYCDIFMNGYANPDLSNVAVTLYNQSGRFPLGTATVGTDGYWFFQADNCRAGAPQLLSCEQVGPTTCDVTTYSISSPSSCDVYDSCTGD